MTPTHIHLLLNHIPIIGSAFGIMLLLYGIIIKSKSVINAALLAFIMISLFAIPVFLTGEPAEELVENISGINKASIEEHEESAELAFWVMGALGAFSLLTLVLHKKNNILAGKLVVASFVFALIAFAFMAKTGSEGGKIRHTELTGSGGTAETINEAGGESEGEKDSD